MRRAIFTALALALPHATNIRAAQTTITVLAGRAHTLLSALFRTRLTLSVTRQQAVLLSVQARNIRARLLQHLAHARFRHAPTLIQCRIVSAHSCRRRRDSIHVHVNRVTVHVLLGPHRVHTLILRLHVLAAVFRGARHHATHLPVTQHVRALRRNRLVLAFTVNQLVLSVAVSEHAARQLVPRGQQALILLIFAGFLVLVAHNMLHMLILHGVLAIFVANILGHLLGGL